MGLAGLRSLGYHLEHVGADLVVHGPDDHLHHAAVVGVESHLAPHQHLEFAVEQSGEQEGVHFLGHIDLVALVANAHVIEELNDPHDCRIHVLELELEGLGELGKAPVSLALAPNHLPLVSELPHGDRERKEVVLLLNGGVLQLVVLLVVGADLLMTFNFDLSDLEAHLLLELERGVNALAVRVAQDDVGVALLVELDLVFLVQGDHPLEAQPLHRLETLDIHLDVRQDLVLQRVLDLVLEDDDGVEEVLYNRHQILGIVLGQLLGLG
mmetsp:Transcript_8463/g.14208  ORF Transcript_8463/g.14208 Transcript_8463/m.14208 type:complete len:268 (+) Transcript_8463:34-837(+)